MLEKSEEKSRKLLQRGENKTSVDKIDNNTRDMHGLWSWRGVCRSRVDARDLR